MSRKRRSFTTWKWSLYAPVAEFIWISLGIKQKQWMEESMLAALKAVAEGKSISRGVHATIVSVEQLSMVSIQDPNHTSIKHRRKK